MGRTSQALVSNPLTAMAQQLEQRFIELRLISQSQVAAQSVLASIRRLLLDDARRGRRSPRRSRPFGCSCGRRGTAAIIGRARLVAVMVGIEQALIAFGARLTTPILIDMRVIHESLGIPSTDGA